MREHRRSEQARASDPSESGSDTEPAVDGDRLLSILGDEYARGVLSALGDESLPARAIAERSGVSRPTVYRRLDRLERAGIVSASMAIHPDGQHRKEFRVVLDEVEISLPDETSGETDGATDGVDRSAASATE
ncbi:ArsR/SmtB family transcription factor [Halosimplex sp. TS25]|uniref:ArsR/SmtB family transcription factor n=1 Tax=Halosimplex rarum TaxID=3396619 RepID=UPI0039EA6EAF